MALIVLLVINLLVINLNFTEAADNEDKAVNGFLPWLRELCAICEAFIKKVTEAYNNFFKSFLGNGASSTPPLKSSMRSGIQTGRNLIPLQKQSPRRPSPRQLPVGQGPVTNPPFIPTRPHRDIYEIDKVHIQDLESAVYLILNDHLSRFDKLEGVEVISSIAYLLYFIYVDFPNYPKVPLAAKMVYDYIYDRNQLDRMELRQKVVEATTQHNIQGGKYVSCGDLAEPQDCSLWLLFHMISLHYSVRTNSSRIYGPVPYILQYVFKFNDKMIPGVALKMTQMQNVTDHKLAALQLWDWHNEAINRHYPSAQKCQECYNGPPELTREAVYKYLVKFYTSIDFNSPSPT